MTLHVQQDSEERGPPGGAELVRAAGSDRFRHRNCHAIPDCHVGSKSSRYLELGHSMGLRKVVCGHCRPDRCRWQQTVRHSVAESSLTPLVRTKPLLRNKPWVRYVIAARGAVFTVNQ